MIYLKDITLAFGAKTIFAGISWNITERSRIGLVGDNGAGKTTLLKAIRGDVELDGGAIEIADRKNKTLAYLPQDLEELPPHVTEALHFHFVERMPEVLAVAIG